VTPGVTHVVLVDEGFALPLGDRFQAYATLVLYVDLPFGVRIGVEDATGGEGVEVGVRPPHRGLDDAVEPPEGRVARDQESASDSGSVSMRVTLSWYVRTSRW
jgi:hypothetical protein